MDQKYHSKNQEITAIPHDGKEQISDRGVNPEWAMVLP